MDDLKGDVGKANKMYPRSRLKAPLRSYCSKSNMHRHLSVALYTLNFSIYVLYPGLDIY